MEEELLKSDELFGDEFSHPSYGMMSFHRLHGGDTALFGSSIKHNTTIRIDVHEAVRCRNLHRDSFFPRKLILSASMSPTQFANAITSMDMGSGIPITLEYVRDGDSVAKVDKCPFVSKHAEFSQEFTESMENLSTIVDPVIEEAKRRKLPRVFIQQLEIMQSRIKSNLPFVERQFVDQMEHTVTEAKGDIEAFAVSVALNHGLDSIKELSPKLDDEDDNDRASE